MAINEYSDSLESGAGYYIIKLEDKRGDTVKVESQRFG
jgi:parvulin-like peptidyl-prolyl isomerase